MEFPENELRENRVKIYMKKYAKVVKMTDHIEEKNLFWRFVFYYDGNLRILGLVFCLTTTHLSLDWTSDSSEQRIGLFFLISD